MNGILTITHLTLHEARGRKVVMAALLLGLAFLLLFAIGFTLIYNDAMARSGPLPRIQQTVGLNFVVLAGLYAVNFLVVMMAVLMPIDTLSGDIRSGSIQTLVTKPIPRAHIVIGKWLAFWLILAAYLLLMAGGVLFIVRIVAGFIMPNTLMGVALILLEGTLLMTLTILGGTRLSTLANGVVVLGLYGLAFIGGWMEQIGTLLGNIATQNFGVVASLLMPSESLWQLASYSMQPPLMRDAGLTPFSVTSVPSPWIVVWAALYTLVVLLIALRQFNTRDL
jgi:ABC-type transport system involved in multi-copper enzyme maturation permease subunit